MLPTGILQVQSTGISGMTLLTNAGKKHGEGSSLGVSGAQGNIIPIKPPYSVFPYSLLTPSKEDLSVGWQRDEPERKASFYYRDPAT